MPSSIVGTDTGGTFTDFVMMEADRLIVHKTPSTPAELSQAVATGLEELPLSSDTVVAHGSTVATNALLERKGARTALVTTAGFEDVLQIGRQARHGLYDLQYQAPEPLAPPDLRLGVLEWVDAAGNVLQDLSAEEVRRVAARLRALEVDAVAVALLFSFLRPEHEERLRLAFEQMEPQPFISLSSEVLPEFREYERTSTVTVNSYVGPLVSRYLGRMEELVQRPLRVMQSSGGGITAALARRQPVRTILSGPAGGVIGATYVAGAAGFAQVITLDMGGTSTDVALCPGRVQRGRLPHKRADDRHPDGRSRRQVVGPHRRGRRSAGGPGIGRGIARPRLLRRGGPSDGHRRESAAGKDGPSPLSGRPDGPRQGAGRSRNGPGGDFYGSVARRGRHGGGAGRQRGGGTRAGRPSHSRRDTCPLPQTPNPS